MTPSTRRLARELALQAMFQKEFLGHIDMQANLSLFRGKYAAPDEVWDYAKFLCDGVMKHLEKIDGIIQAQSAHWSLKRMALVDLIIMRIACFEIKIADQPVPPAAAINEAIEISRKYGTTDSASFVNGILDQIARN